MPGTMVRGGCSRAASIASARSSRGRRVPSELVVWVWRSTPPAIAREILPPAVHRRDVPEQRAHPAPGGALGAERQLALGERGARDVEVRPRNPGGELAHEQGGHDGPRAALARDVVEIRDVALEPFPVLVVER